MFQLIIAISLLCFAGGLTFYWLIPTAMGSAQLRQDLANLARKFKISTRYSTELGGYVHDTHVTQFFAPNTFNYVTGTWADAAGAVAHTFAKKATLGDNTATISIPIIPMQNSSGLKGFYLTSIDIWWEVTVAALDALAATIYSVALPADTAIMVATSLPFSYDTGHDTAGERLTLEQHKMTLTLTTPIWLDDDVLINVELSVDGAATSVVAMHGARANGTLRL